ncbi:MAG: hypothetical protein MI749_18140 [Desulfovibrionales bacterium]|nr:hypothetical protein [Desulfovibrionales bacterium]
MSTMIKTVKAVIAKQNLNLAKEKINFEIDESIFCSKPVRIGDSWMYKVGMMTMQTDQYLAPSALINSCTREDLSLQEAHLMNIAFAIEKKKNDYSYR